MSRDFARRLRKNMTEAEVCLWQSIRYRQLFGYKFRRQAPVGSYIVDFVCFERKLVLELDGGQHAEQVEQDELRTEWLNSQGFRVLRFWNHDVLESLDAILEVIGRELKEDKPLMGATPHPTLPHKGGGVV